MARTWSKADHGTSARYKKHIRDKDIPCEPCKIANADDSRERRDGRQSHETDKLKKRAESRAKTRLIKMFYTEFYVLYKQELEKEGFTIEGESE